MQTFWHFDWTRRPQSAANVESNLKSGAISSELDVRLTWPIANHREILERERLPKTMAVELEAKVAGIGGPRKVDSVAKRREIANEMKRRIKKEKRREGGKEREEWQLC